MDDTNTNIVEGLRHGNENALRQLYDQYSSILLAYAKHNIRNPLLAEDFVQDAFCILWENRSKLKAELPVQSYLFRLVHSKCIDFLRKQKAQSNYSQYIEWKLREMEITQLSFENNITSEIFTKEVQTIIQQTLQILPEQTREIFQLSRNHFLKNIEIAEKKNLSVKAVEYHISKALTQLKNSLRDFF